MENELIPIVVKGVMPTSGGAAVFLGTEVKTFVIHMDPTMGSTITMHLQHVHPERPLTHDLIQSMFIGLGVSLEHVIISDIQESTFFSRIILKMRNELGTKVIEIDARPSDAIILALQAQRPILIARKVFEQVEDITHILTKLLEENKQEFRSDEEDSEGNLGNPGLF